MNKVKILTDSTSDLYRVAGRDLYKEMDVDVIPLYVSFNDEVYRDGINIVPEEMYKLVDEKGFLPKTSCASPGDYYDFFKKYIDEGYDIVFLGIGAGLSGGYRTANLTAQEFDAGRVYIVDSASLSSAIGLLFHQAYLLREKGLSAKEIAEKVGEMAKRVKTSFVIDTLDYLYKGGRCSGVSKLLGNLFSIKPIIEVIDGKLSVGQKLRGKKNALNAMFDSFKNDWEKDNVVIDRIMITHTVVDVEAEYLKAKMIEIGVPEDKIVISSAGCVIASHCGPKCIGILYITKN